MISVVVHQNLTVQLRICFTKLVFDVLNYFEYRRPDHNSISSLPMFSPVSAISCSATIGKNGLTHTPPCTLDVQVIVVLGETILSDSTVSRKLDEEVIHVEPVTTSVNSQNWTKISFRLRWQWTLGILVCRLIFGLNLDFKWNLYSYLLHNRLYTWPCKGVGGCANLYVITNALGWVEAGRWRDESPTFPCRQVLINVQVLVRSVGCWVCHGCRPSVASCWYDLLANSRITLGPEYNCTVMLLMYKGSIGSHVFSICILEYLSGLETIMSGLRARSPEPSLSWSSSHYEDERPALWWTRSREHLSMTETKTKREYVLIQSQSS